LCDITLVYTGIGQMASALTGPGVAAASLVMWIVFLEWHMYMESSAPLHISD